MSDAPAIAWMGGFVGSRLVDHTQDVTSLNGSGKWVVVADFEGAVHCLKFADWTRTEIASVAGPWNGPATNDYSSSLDRSAYVHAVERVRQDIAKGLLYQANICRVMSAPMPQGAGCDVVGLAALLAQRNPAPYLAAVRVPQLELHIASASPELFLARDGRRVSSSPIKGTGRTRDDLSAKDRAENVMIVDLVRNDLGRVCEPGSVGVPSLLRIEPHPTLVHLVSTVEGQLRSDCGWPELFEAAFPPGSVSGAPKLSALTEIERLEPVERGPYCGAIGWVDADRQKAELAVGIRTFWLTPTDSDDSSDSRYQLHFGTGAGITWGSDPAAEWAESQLKAAHLIDVASGEWTG